MTKLVLTKLVWQAFTDPSILGSISMDSSETRLVEHQSPDALLNSEEIPDYFLCCVCLDLLYKPIVLHCGHISCFWCVHKSMSYRNESYCPICRNPYSHFPGICQMLHFLLLKLYPITYKKREEQILEEEKRLQCFSPELNGHACESQADEELNYLGIHVYSDSPSTSKKNLSKPAGEVESDYNGTTWGENSDVDLNIKPVAGKEDQVSVADVLCTACKQFLFCPVVLNCGHVYCQTCIIIPGDKKLRCQVCQCMQPKGCPKVCLTFDQFLAAKFPKEYALRRDAVQLKQVASKHERATTCSMETGNHDFSPIQLPSRDPVPSPVGPNAHAHIGVGCDACGMSPIVGDRYKCKDCTEKMGFDLCGDCYNTRPKLPGRFNQRHTPEHKFELIRPDTPRSLMLITQQLENVSPYVIFDDDVVILENGTTPRTLFGGPQDNTSNNIPARFHHNDSMEDQDDTRHTD
ncbi:hypothetical protein DITRI_Ditri13aG0115000 [Diplodiscus trichospermus]